MALKSDSNRRKADDAPEASVRESGKEPAGPLGRIVDAVNRNILDRSASEDNSADASIKEQLSQIHVVAFIGSSGTGKSTRAIRVAQQYSIDHIIDDGLLINGSRIVAGSSAKRAGSKLESVRQALFADPTRAVVMRRALTAQMPKNLMVLGTSDGMVTRICENLWLPQPTIIIRIEDVSTEDEMRQAKETRLTEGMHSIPVPSMEIKHEFSGYFSDPLARIRRRRERERGVPAAMPDSERTVVRPTFSSLGSYSLSDEALRNLVEIVLRNTQGVYSLLGFSVIKEVYGIILYLDISLYYGFNAQEVLASAQKRISSRIEEYTSINVMEVNVRARRVVHASGSTYPERKREKKEVLPDDRAEEHLPHDKVPDKTDTESDPDPSDVLTGRVQQIGRRMRRFFTRE